MGWTQVRVGQKVEDCRRSASRQASTAKSNTYHWVWDRDQRRPKWILPLQLQGQRRQSEVHGVNPVRKVLLNQRNSQIRFLVKPPDFVFPVLMNRNSKLSLTVSFWSTNIWQLFRTWTSLLKNAREAKSWSSLLQLRPCQHIWLLLRSANLSTLRRPSATTYRFAFTQPWAKKSKRGFHSRLGRRQSNISTSK